MKRLTGARGATEARPTLVALVVLTGVFLSSLDLFIVNIAFPSISVTFHGEGLSSLSWVLSAYTIVFAALLVPAGRWADRTGRKRAFLLGLAIFTASSALCALAPSLGMLIAARILQASGGALMLPTSLGLLLPAFGPARKGAAIGLWSAVGGAAAALGPPIGGLLVQASWRWVFLVNVPFSLLALVVGIRILSEVKDPAAHRSDMVGAALFGGRGQPGRRHREGVGLGLAQCDDPVRLRRGRPFGCRPHRAVPTPSLPDH
jgi:MFS family permease